MPNIYISIYYYYHYLYHNQNMADRSSIRTMFSILEAVYDSFVVAGFAYATYESFRTMDTLEAEEGEALVVDRYFLPPRIVTSTSYFFSKPTRIHTVPHYLDQQVRVAMANKDNNLLQFHTRLRLHALDPVAAKNKYGSGLKEKYLNIIESILRNDGGSLKVNEGNQEEIRLRLQKKIRDHLDEGEQDFNILQEVYVEEVKEIPMPRRVLPELL